MKFFHVLSGAMLIMDKHEGGTALKFLDASF